MFFKSLFPALLWALFILIICGIPGQHLPRLDFWKWVRPDKLVHLFVFAVLCYLLINGFVKQERLNLFRKNPKLCAVLLSISYGIVIECLQEYVFIDRTGDVRDAIANSIGAFAGLWCFNLLQKKRLHRNSTSS